MLGQVIKGHLRNYPQGEAVRLELPKSFKGYIDYTKRDHKRNANARTVHKQFYERG